MPLWTKEGKPSKTYKCTKCHKEHHKNSAIGRLHWGYAQHVISILKR